MYEKLKFSQIVQCITEMECLWIYLWCAGTTAALISHFQIAFIIKNIWTSTVRRRSQLTKKTGRNLIRVRSYRYPKNSTCNQTSENRAREHG